MELIIAGVILILIIFAVAYNKGYIKEMYHKMRGCMFAHHCGKNFYLVNNTTDNPLGQLLPNWELRGALPRDGPIYRYLRFPVAGSI